MIVVFIRDEVARPAIGSHDADRFLPFLWSQFFFLLFLNVFGLVPWVGSPTGALGVTGAMALVTLGWWWGRAWPLRAPGLLAGTGAAHGRALGCLAVFVKPMIFGIEVLGISSSTSSWRCGLFANMFAGHLVLAVIMGFIAGSGALAALVRRDAHQHDRRDRLESLGSC